MTAQDWSRALQLLMLPVGAGPVLVGSLLGAALANRVDFLLLGVVVSSVVAIQAGANVHKGIAESDALGVRPARPRSPFVFDAGAVHRLEMDNPQLVGMVFGLYGAGAFLGLVAVLLAREPYLLVFGFLGAFFAYSYSGKPFQLSFKGLGELATFLAFGPIMLVGAAVAQFPPLLSYFSPDQWSLTLNPVPLLLGFGAAFGFLAALISFARYFPARAEDAKKGKMTPVVKIGPQKAANLFFVLALGAAASFAFTAQALVPFVVCDGGVATAGRLAPDAMLLACAILSAAVGLLGARGLRSTRPEIVEKAVTGTVLLHYSVTVLAVIRAATLYLPQVCPL